MGCVTSSEAEPRSEARHLRRDSRRGKQEKKYVIRTKADLCAFISIDFTCHVGRGARSTPSPRTSGAQRSVATQISRNQTVIQPGLLAPTGIAEAAAARMKGIPLEHTSLWPAPPSSPSPLPQARAVSSPQWSRQPSSASSSTHPASLTAYPLPQPPAYAPRLSPPSSPPLCAQLPLAQLPLYHGPSPLLPLPLPLPLPLLPAPQTALPPRPLLHRLPPELWTRVTSHLDKGSWDSLRLCSRETRAALDATVTRLRVVYGSAVPTQRAPASAAAVEEALRGLLSRGCRPRSVSLCLSDCQPSDPERAEKGRVVLAAVAQLPSLEELTVSGLCLSPLGRSLWPPLPHPHVQRPGASMAAAAAAVAAVRNVARLRLAGISTSDVSLHPGLQVLLPAATRLCELELCNLDISSLALSCPGSPRVHPAWQPLWEAERLRRLVLNFRDGGADAAVNGAAGALSLGHGVAGMTQLRALGLGLWRDDGGYLLAAALPTISAALTDLQCLELRMDSPPLNLLACLAGSLTRLQVLALYCEQCNGGLQDVHLLRQLTALTSLTLVNALPPGGLQPSVPASAAFMSSGKDGNGDDHPHDHGRDCDGDGTGYVSYLPPALKVLRLNRPLSVCQLASLAIPPSLTRVTFGGTSEPMLLPDAGIDPEEVNRQVAVAAAKLAVWGVQDLALRAPSPPPPPTPAGGPANAFIQREAVAIRYTRLTWIRELAPLRLRCLRLYDIALDAASARALAAAVGSSLEELTVDGAGASLVRLLPGAICMPRLRMLTVLGSACEGMSNVRGRDVDGGGVGGRCYGCSWGGGPNSIHWPSVLQREQQKQPWGQLGSQRRRQLHQEQRQQHQVFMSGYPEAAAEYEVDEDADKDVDEEQEEQEEEEDLMNHQAGDWTSTLLALLARGVNVRLCHNVAMDFQSYQHHHHLRRFHHHHNNLLSGLRRGLVGFGGAASGDSSSDAVASVVAAEAVSAAVHAMCAVGQCCGWGRLEVHVAPGMDSPVRRWGQLAWNEIT